MKVNAGILAPFKSYCQSWSVAPKFVSSMTNQFMMVIESIYIHFKLLLCLIKHGYLYIQVRDALNKLQAAAISKEFTFNSVILNCGSYYLIQLFLDKTQQRVMSFHPSIPHHLSVCPFVCQGNSPSIHPALCQFIHLSMPF